MRPSRAPYREPGMMSGDDVTLPDPGSRLNVLAAPLLVLTSVSTAMLQLHITHARAAEPVNVRFT